MSITSYRGSRTIVAALTLAALALTATAPALASHVSVRTSAPASVSVGELVQVPVIAEAASRAPVEGMTLELYLHASFAGVTGEIGLGRAITDESGSADFAYRPRLAGAHELRMAYVAPGDSEVEVIDTVFEPAGGEQLYRSEPGIEIPGLDARLIIAALATAWLTLFGVALRFVTISRAGGEALSSARRQAG